MLLKPALPMMNDRSAQEPTKTAKSDAVAAANSDGLCLSVSERSWLAEHQTIRMGVEANFAPWEFVDERGQHSGIIAEYMKLLEARLGIRLKTVVQPRFETLNEMAEQRDLDLLPGLVVTQERSRYLKFTRSYVDSADIAAFARTDAPRLDTVEDLVGRKVAFVTKHASVELLLKTNPGIVPIHFDSVADALVATVDGVTEATISGFVTAAYHIRKMGLVDLKVVTRITRRLEALHIGVRKDWPILVQILDKAVASITSVEHREIRHRWIEVRLPYELSVMKNEQRLLTARNKLLDEQNEELEAYARTIAHSLKTPLAATQLFLDAFSIRMDKKMSIDERELLEEARTTLKNSGTIVEGLLLLATLSHEQAEISALNMQQLVAEALRQLEAHRAQVGAEVKLPEHWIDAVGFAPWVGEVWLNYLSNALKYCPPPVKIEIGCAEDRLGQVRYWVQDNGNPLSKKEGSRLFVPFVRLHQDQGAGHGLGLSIVQRIVERLGGTVGLETPDCGGNRFFFTVPRYLDTP